ncbi:MAG: VOC family protein [Leptospiraceae bacterium]|nr:VOC family protein [Leptospiraceae bacterium]
MAKKKKIISKKKVAKKKATPKKPKVEQQIHPLIGWIELNTQNTDSSTNFYTELFGWKTKVQNIPDMGPYTMFGKNSKNLMGGISKPMDPNSASHWLIYFTVKNVDKSVAEALRLGATVIAPAMDIPDGRIAILIDPTGAIFAVWQPK